MAFYLTVPKEYGYVLLTATATLALSTWHGARVGPFRKAAGVPYPHPYASQSDISSADSPEKKQAQYLFNCAQRAHANFLENHTNALAGLLIGGLRYPLLASAVGALWMVFRVLYAVGYTRKDKQEGRGRLVGGGFWLCQLALYGMAGMVGFKMVF